MKKILSTLFLSLLININSFANSKSNDESNIKDFLLKAGFENIQIKKIEESNNKDYYIISYENRTFLHEIHAISHVLSNLKNIIKNNSKLDLIIQSSGNNVLKIGLNYNDYLDFMNTKISEKEFSEKLDFIVNPTIEIDSKKENNLLLHSDLLLGPGYILNNLTGPTILVASAFNTFFGSGFDFFAKYALPIYNIGNNFDFEKNFKLYSPKFQTANLTYFTGFPNIPLYTTFKTGYNYNDSNDIFISNNSKYNFLDGALSLNLSTGFIKRTTTNTEFFTIAPYIQYYNSTYDVLAEVGGGTFMGNEYGFWGRLNRQFDNSDLGFAVYRTWHLAETKTFLAFEYRLAVGPEKSITASPLRVTYPRYFPGNIYAGTPIGGEIPISDVNIYMKRLYPDYIKRHLYYFKENN